MTHKLTLRTKLFYLTAFLLASFSITLCFYLKTHFAKILSDELLNRGVSIAKHVAEVCTGAFIESDYLQLESLAKEHKEAEKDIVYILMLDQNNNVVAHSFANGHPLDLEKIAHTLKGGHVSIQNVDFGGVPLYDIASPVLDARIGSVRIGISAQPVHQAVDAMIGQILVTILILGLIALIIALPVLQTIIRPISTLTHAVKQLSRGELEQELTVTHNDELGLLTNAFNHMVAAVKSSEKRLAAHADFLQALIDDIPIPVFYKDLKGVMLGCNSAYVDFWGKSYQDVVGYHTDIIYDRADAELHLRKDSEVLEQQSPVSYEHAVIDAKGQAKHIFFNKALFCDETGQPAGIIGVMHDVTRQRTADMMKDEFVSTVAHEFQTPLATILGFTELLRDNMLSQNERKEALDLVAMKAETLSEMVDELLDLARIEAGKGLNANLEPCNVNEVLFALVDNFRKRKTGHYFVLELPDEKVVISADKSRMGQVMENLLSNAIKYSDNHSTIKVVVSSNDTHCQVQVFDQGIGMTEKQVEQVFEKYYRVNTSNTAPSGTGLGLFITKSIIDAHNGQIEVDSSPGEGTVVTFRIPTHAV